MRVCARVRRILATWGSGTQGECRTRDIGITLGVVHCSLTRLLKRRRATRGAIGALSGDPGYRHGLCIHVCVFTCVCAGSVYPYACPWRP